MASTPPQSSLFRSWYHEVREIKDLFYSRKYKRCAARCEDLLESAVHPLHKTFLHFYQALSYESLGIAAHIYSTNKLSLLNLARDEFKLALQCLPQPFIPSIDFSDERHPDHAESPSLNSPPCVTLEVMKRYQIPSPMVTGSSITISTGSSKISRHRRNKLWDDADDEVQHDCSSSISSIDSDPRTCVADNQTPDFDAYSPRRELFSEPQKFTRRPPEVHLTTPMCASATNPVAIDNDANSNLSTGRTLLSTRSNHSSNHKVRLSQSLSSTHCLADELVPSPLFNKVRTYEDEISNPDTPSKPEPCTLARPTGNTRQSHNNHHLFNDKENDNASLARTDNEHKHLDRPLPSLPFNHQPTFIRRGSRHVLQPLSANLPMNSKPRASAIETLVAKFEGKIHAAAQNPITPLTPRFKLIEKAFEVKSTTTTAAAQPSNPSKPTASTSQTTTTPTSTHNQQPVTNITMNLHLTSFRTSLHNHLAQTNARIETVTKAQTAHRAKGMSRAMSFWSFEPVVPSDGGGGDGTRGRVTRRREMLGQ